MLEIFISIESNFKFVSYSMRDEELVVIETLKVRALPESNYDHLLNFLRLYCNADQVIVNRI
jgi:hypothetical protein